MSDTQATDGAAPSVTRPTIGAAIDAAGAALAAAGLDAPRREARLLAERALGLDPADAFAHPERIADRAGLDRLDSWVARRRRREPISHIIGERAFWSLTLAVNDHVLDPRPDSETLIEAIVTRLRPAQKRAPLSILDIGTGSGCLLLALLSELPAAWGLGTDRSGAAIRVAAANAGTAGLGERARFAVMNWTQSLAGQFDIVVSNPPYIRSDAIAGLAPEVARYEPRLALDGGADGLDAYRALAPDLTRIVKPGGLIALEIGADQARPVAGILGAAGLAVPETMRDLGGRDRCLVTQR